ESVALQIESFFDMKTLDLRGNTRCIWGDIFTGRLKTEIPPILRSMCAAVMNANCHILELDLSDNAFGPIGAEACDVYRRLQLSGPSYRPNACPVHVF
ncbi:hypothetical protein ANCDUO_26946, partial [Ancylostoma duodenale]